MQTPGEVLHAGRQFPHTAPKGDMLTQSVSSSRTDQSSIAKLVFYMAIQAARERIWIENAYFVPDRQIREGLVRAAARGVDVKVIVPGKYIDVPSVRLASRFRYGELLDGGVQVFEFQPTMMHNKVMVVDSLWASSSINFVNRSMRKNAGVRHYLRPGVCRRRQANDRARPRPLRGPFEAGLEETRPSAADWRTVLLAVFGQLLKERSGNAANAA
jgi:cardiolipin synthase